MSFLLRRYPLLSGSSVLIVGSAIAGVVNYLFTVIMGRGEFLGPSGFGTLTALSALLYLDGVVTAGLATSTAYFVAAAAARGEPAGVGDALRRVLRWTVRAALPAAFLLVAVSPWLSSFLRLNSWKPILILVPVLVVAPLLGVLSGGLQGTLRFTSLAAVTVAGAVLRLLFAVALVRGGWGVEGAILASFFAVLLALILALWLLRSLFALARDQDASGGFSLREFLVAGGPTTLAFLGLTLLFTLDTVLAKHYLTAEAAGLYGAISTLGRVVYFAALPLTLIMFPVVTQRVAQGRTSWPVLLVSGAGFLLIGAAVTILYGTVPDWVLRLTFGGAYRSGAPLLVLGSLLFTAIAAATWLSHVALAFRKMWMVALPATGAVLQALLLLRFHDSTGTILRASLAAVLAVVVVQALGLAFFWRRSLRVPVRAWVNRRGSERSPRDTKGATFEP